MHLLGIIGHNILKDYEVFIDLYLNQITLSKVDKHGNKYDAKVYAETISDSLDFDLKKHTIVVLRLQRKCQFRLYGEVDFLKSYHFTVLVYVIYILSFYIFKIVFMNFEKTLLSF